MKSIQVFKCPSNTTTTSVTSAGSISVPQSYLAVGGNNNANQVDGSGMTTWWGGRVAMVYSATSIANQIPATTLAQFETPATTIMVGEHESRNQPEFFASDTDAFLFTNHLGTTNFLFADGHVKSLKPSATLNPNMWTIADDGNSMPSAVRSKITARQADMN